MFKMYYTARPNIYFFCIRNDHNRQAKCLWRILIVKANKKTIQSLIGKIPTISQNLVPMYDQPDSPVPTLTRISDEHNAITITLST